MQHRNNPLNVRYKETLNSLHNYLQLSYSRPPARQSKILVLTAVFTHTHTRTHAQKTTELGINNATKNSMASANPAAWPLSSPNLTFLLCIKIFTFLAKRKRKAQVPNCRHHNFSNRCFSANLATWCFNT